MLLSYLQSRSFGLAHLLGDTFILGLEIGIVVGLVAHDGGIALVFAGVGSYVGEDTQLGDIGVVFGVGSFEFGMQGGVAGAGQAGIAFIDLDVGISLAEVDQAG